MDFEFEAEFEDISKVPEDFRGLYTREGDEGPYKLGTDHDGVKSAVAAIGRLNGALKSERAAHKAAKGKAVDLSDLSEFGATPAEIKSAIDAKLGELTEKVQGGEKIKIDIDKVKADLAAGHAKDMDVVAKRNEALQGQLHELLVNNAALAALGDSIDPELVMPFISQQVKAQEVDGEYVVVVVDSTGDVRYSGSTGQPMSIGELVKEMKNQDKYKPLFKSEVLPGSGHRPGTGSTQVKVSGKDTRSATDKIAAGLKNRK